MIAMAISLATAFHRLLHLLIQYLALPHLQSIKVNKRDWHLRFCRPRGTAGGIALLDERAKSQSMIGYAPLTSDL